MTYCLVDFKILSNLPYWNIESFTDEKPYQEEKFYNLFESAVLLRSKADVETASFCLEELTLVRLLKSKLI